MTKAILIATILASGVGQAATVLIHSADGKAGVD